jgi:hypothetical protein
MCEASYARLMAATSAQLEQSSAGALSGLTSLQCVKCQSIFSQVKKQYFFISLLKIIISPPANIVTFISPAPIYFASLTFIFLSSYIFSSHIPHFFFRLFIYPLK